MTLITLVYHLKFVNFMAKLILTFNIFLRIRCMKELWDPTQVGYMLS